jgi:hypothetical protein
MQVQRYGINQLFLASVQINCSLGSPSIWMSKLNSLLSVLFLQVLRERALQSDEELCDRDFEDKLTLVLVLQRLQPSDNAEGVNAAVC